MIKKLNFVEYYSLDKNYIATLLQENIYPAAAVDSLFQLTT